MLQAVVTCMVFAVYVKGMDPDRHLQQQTVDYIGHNLVVHFNAINNLEKYKQIYVNVNVTLFNNGSLQIPTGAWRIYLYSLYGLIEETAPCNLTVHHENGALYYLSPAGSGFRGIPAKQSVSCLLHNKNWVSSRTDNFPSWYVTSPCAQSVVIKSTVGEQLDFVGQFDTPEKWKRSAEDQYDPTTPQERYERNKVRDYKQPGGYIIPTPKNVTKLSDKLLFLSQNEWKILESSEFKAEANFLAELQNFTIASSHPRSQYVQFVKSSAPQNPEAYKLTVDPQSKVITIEAWGAPGAFYGVQSLVALIDPANRKVPCVHISDRPRFGYRGLFLDVARNFRPVSTVLRVIDLLAMYKMNRLHFHISDNEAWRLELPGIPELTQIGARRCHDNFNQSCVLPALGSGPDSSGFGSGFYSVKQYKEIIRYASRRHVTIIPEIDMPGHSRAAIQAMAVREKNLRGRPSYLLSDGASKNTRTLKWMDNAINPCLNTSYAFVEKIIDELKAIHEPIQPLRMFHLGGDEVATGVWDNSEACRKNFPNIPSVNATDTIKDMFVKKVMNIIANKNLSAVAWEDGLLDSSGVPFSKASNRDTFAMAWDNKWEAGHGRNPYELANTGHKVILALATHLYFDHPYEVDPEERGLYWATRSTDTQKVFGFIPGDVYANIDVSRMGVPLTRERICQEFSCPPLQHKENILGIQACLWSETMRTEDEFYYMGFPRILALAERAWHEADWETCCNTDQKPRDSLRDQDWERFANQLAYKELNRLEELGVQYRVPPPGAVIEGSRLRVNTEFPGLMVLMSDDGGRTWIPVSDSVELGSGSHEIRLKTRSSILNRSSRIVSLSTTVTSRSDTAGPTISLIGGSLVIITLALARI